MFRYKYRRVIYKTDSFILFRSLVKLWIKFPALTKLFKVFCLHNQTNYKFPSDGLKVSHSSPTSKYMPILKYVVQNWNKFITKMSSSNNYMWIIVIVAGLPEVNLLNYYLFNMQRARTLQNNQGILSYRFNYSSPSTMLVTNLCFKDLHDNYNEKWEKMNGYRLIDLKN